MDKNKQIELVDEDQIIIDGLTLIGKGVAAGSWKTVCQGYFNITGIELLPPEDEKPTGSISRLEKIKSGLASVEQKSKQKNKNSQPPPLLTEDVKDEDLVVIKTKRDRRTVGARRFGKDEMEIITMSPDEKEIKQNRKEARNNKVARDPNVLEQYSRGQDIRLRDLSETPRGSGK